MQEAWKRVPLLTHGSAREPGLFDGDAHQLVAPRRVADVYPLSAPPPPAPLRSPRYRQSAMQQFARDRDNPDPAEPRGPRRQTAADTTAPARSSG